MQFLDDFDTRIVDTAFEAFEALCFRVYSTSFKTSADGGGLGGFGSGHVGCGGYCGGSSSGVGAHACGAGSEAGGGASGGAASGAEGGVED